MSSGRSSAPGYEPEYPDRCDDPHYVDGRVEALSSPGILDACCPLRNLSTRSRIGEGGSETASFSHREGCACRRRHDTCCVRSRPDRVGASRDSASRTCTFWSRRPRRRRRDRPSALSPSLRNLFGELFHRQPDFVTKTGPWFVIGLANPIEPIRYRHLDVIE